MTESTEFLTQDEAASALVSYIFSGAIGPPEDKGVTYALVEATPSYFTWTAALENLGGPPKPLDRYLVKMDRRSKAISPPSLITLPEQELSEIIQLATGMQLKSWTRFTDGALSISYKVDVRESLDTSFIVQLRHHGNVESMDCLISFITKTIDAQILPVPPAYPIPGEGKRQKDTGMGRQITRYIPGVMCSSVYHDLAHEDKLIVLPQIARAFAACWEIQLPEPRLIGEVIATEVDGKTSFKIGPDRHHSLGGPFDSVREYLAAYIRSSLVSLEKQQGINEYKTVYLDPLRNFVSNCLEKIPPIVEQVPVIMMHSDMGPHNIIMSRQSVTEIKAIIDWEFIASAPLGSIHRILEMFFRISSINGFGHEYEHSHQLRAIFWGAIPEWRQAYESEPMQTFLQWFRFGLFLKPEWRPNDLSELEKERYWRENIRVVEEMLHQYGESQG